MKGWLLARQALDMIGLGRAEASISTAELAAKFVTLRGSRGGRAAVLAHMKYRELAIEAFEGLKHRGVVGRLVATDPA
jgi:hypothetical protein